MNFKFYFKESKIYDFLHFPALVFTKERQEKSQSERDSKEFHMEDYVNFINKAESKLKPHLKDI